MKRLAPPALFALALATSAAAQDTAPSPAEAEQAAPEAPPPPAPGDHAADRAFDPKLMAAARAQLRREHGGQAYSMVLLNLAEYQAATPDGWRWDGEAWFGGDIDRIVVKSEGSGTARGIETAEVQGLYSKAVGPYFNLQAGLRHDFGPLPARTYATVGFEGLAPYWFEVSGAVFVSNRGEVLGRLEGGFDLRITQRLILQPRAEINFAAQDAADIHIGSGVSDGEAGLRLRYEIRRDFAPYIGLSYERKFGRTADFARAVGRDRGGTGFVVGVRTWF